MSSFRPGWMIGLPDGASLVFGDVKAVARAAKPARTVAVVKCMFAVRIGSQLVLWVTDCSEMGYLKGHTTSE